MRGVQPAEGAGQTVERLANALSFICGADHPATIAAQKAARGGVAEDAAKARKLFEKIKPSLQRAVLAMIEPPQTDPTTGDDEA